MTKSFFILTFCLSLSACVSTGSSSREHLGDTALQDKPSEAPQWQLVWSDEFDYSGLPDSTKWQYEVGKIRNNEEQYYAEARLRNTRVENGHLIIEAHREESKIAEYSSGSITTQGRQTWTYGRIEVKAKVPTGVGTWPAIWMLGKNIPEAGWPLCGEIDLMENVGFDPDVVHGNVHTQRFNHKLGTNKGERITADKPYEKFHVYAVEWFEDRIDFYHNDTKYFTFENDGGGVESWPFFEDQYLILNLAVGGSWGGQQGVDKSIWPQRMEVDYVRVYKKM